jgi:hypothetical protein
VSEIIRLKNLKLLYTTRYIYIHRPIIIPNPKIIGPMVSENHSRQLHVLQKERKISRRILNFLKFKYLYFKNIISQTIDHNRYSKIHLTQNTISNGYISYRQAFFTNFENRFFVFNFKSQNKTITYNNNNNKINKFLMK